MGVGVLVLLLRPHALRRLRRPVPATVELPAAAPASAGFYASSWGSASTIYRADDPAWRALSDEHLEYFATWSEAIAAHPDYHLHDASRRDPGDTRG
jgi:hypothetical protein